MKAKISYSVVVSRIVASLILSASLLFLPKINAAIEDTFTKDKLIYYVTKEDQASKTGTVTFFMTYREIFSELSGDVTVPASVVNEGYTYSVTLIGPRAFSGFKKLKSIVIPDTVTSIGEWAFSGCSGLTNIVIPESVTEIGEWALEC